MSDRTDAVVVVGAGVVGVATANSLSRRGFNVVCIERYGAVASSTSFANAGRFCVAALCSGPLASPAAALSVAKMLLLPRVLGGGGGAGDPTPSSLHVSGALVRWGCRFLQNCTPGRHAANTAASVALAAQCQLSTAAALRDMAAVLGEDPAPAIHRTDGTLFVFDAPEKLDKKVAATAAAPLPVTAVPFPSAAAAVAAFPFLAQWRGPLPLVGAVLATSDWTADARLFTAALRRVCEQGGAAGGRGAVRFRFGTSVAGVDVADGRVRAVLTHTGERVPAAAVVVCAGLQTPALLSSWFDVAPGALPLTGMRGYSLELRGCTGAPPVCVVDTGSGSLSLQIVPFPADDRVRVVGLGEFVPGHDATPTGAERAAAADKLLRRVRTVLPDFHWTTASDVWSGMRPMSPDSLPVVSRVPGVSNAYVNCGHGSMGWTTSCATADVVAALYNRDVGHSSPAGDAGLFKLADVMTMERFASWW